RVCGVDLLHALVEPRARLALGGASADMEAARADLYVAFPGAAQVEPPRRIAVLAGMRREHDIRALFDEVVKCDGARLTALASLRCEKEHREVAEASADASAAHLIEPSMDLPHPLGDASAADSAHRFFP